MTDTNIPPATWAVLGFDVVVRFMAENSEPCPAKGTADRDFYAPSDRESRGFVQKVGAPGRS